MVNQNNQIKISAETRRSIFDKIMSHADFLGAVLLGSNVKGLTDELGEYGADKVIVVDNPELETYRTEPYAQALAAVINEYKPEIMLVGATAIGRDLGPTVSARVATGLTADCTKLEIGDFPINAADLVCGTSGNQGYYRDPVYFTGRKHYEHRL